MKDRVSVKGRVVMVLEKPSGEKKTVECDNIVTNEGDQFYAHRAAEEQPATTLFTNGSVTAFDGVCELGTAGNTPAKGSNRSDMTTKVASSEKAIDATYPKTNDGDSRNTGSGTDVITYRFTWAAGEATSTGIDRCIITNPSPGATENCLMYATLPSTVNKESGDTLTVFVNHTFNGS